MGIYFPGFCISIMFLALAYMAWGIGRYFHNRADDLDKDS